VRLSWLVCYLSAVGGGRRVRGPYPKLLINQINRLAPGIIKIPAEFVAHLLPRDAWFSRISFNGGVKVVKILQDLNPLSQPHQFENHCFQSGASGRKFLIHKHLFDL
jgi:hypothetical protein